MPESADPTVAPPRGPVRFGWFGGILEGRRSPATDPGLAEAARSLETDGPVGADLELEGGRFTLLLRDDTLGPDELAGERVAPFVEGLQRVVDASSDPSDVESTLRCTEVYADQVVETLFAAVDGRVHCLSSVREVRAADLARAPAAAAPRVPVLQDLGPRRALLLGGLVLLAFALLTWRSGLIGSLLSTAADELRLEAGPFEGLLSLEVERERLGGYRVAVRRGEGYPRTARDVEALRAGADSPLDLAAVSAAVEGDRIYVQLRDEDGEVLAATGVELRVLLAEADAEATASLGGRRRACSVHLALDPGIRSR